MKTFFRHERVEYNFLLIRYIRQRFKTKHTKLITTGKFTSGKEVGRASLYKNYQTKEDVLRQWAERLNNELNDIRINDDPSLSVLYDI